jgi:hypothetical protein
MISPEHKKAAATLQFKDRRRFPALALFYGLCWHYSTAVCAIATALTPMMERGILKS